MGCRWQRLGCLVVPSLGPGQLGLGADELAGEGLAEEGLRKLLCAAPSRSDALLDVVRQGEEGMDQANNLFLLWNGRERNGNLI
jgi:hypothetical protein